MNASIKDIRVEKIQKGKVGIGERTNELGKAREKWKYGLRLRIVGSVKSSGTFLHRYQYINSIVRMG